MSPLVQIGIGAALCWIGALLIYVGYEPWYSIGNAVEGGGFITMGVVSPYAWFEAACYITAGCLVAAYVRELTEKDGEDEWEQADKEYEDGFWQVGEGQDDGFVSQGSWRGPQQRRMPVGMRPPGDERGSGTDDPPELLQG